LIPDFPPINIPFEQSAPWIRQEQLVGFLKKREGGESLAPSRAQDRHAFAALEVQE
jgi:hypothetical protein